MLCRARCTAARRMTGAVARASGGRCQPRFGSQRLEQLDRIAGRVLYQCLVATDTLDDVAAKTHARTAESLDCVTEIVHFDRKAVPAAGLRLPTIREGRAASHVLSVRLGQHQAQVAP